MHNCTGSKLRVVAVWYCCMIKQQGTKTLTDSIMPCLAGMCRAQGIAHQKVTAAEDLAGALHSAWALKRHSVLEVITGRDTNVDQHRQLQAAVQQAVHQAAALLLPGKEHLPCV